jgi:NAD(P)-dependent dehydrogenase (short-subunit alcohol dehydrogenase family)
MRTIQEARPAMSEGGAIVVIASQNAWRGNEHLAGYTASKHAALGLVRSLALELGPSGIRVNAVGPGSVATDAYLGRLRQRAASGGATVEEALTREAQQTTLQRLTTIDDVARATVFLASDLASGVSGHVLPVGPATR